MSYMNLPVRACVWLSLKPFHTSMLELARIRECKSILLNALGYAQIKAQHCRKWSTVVNYIFNLANICLL